MLYALASRPEVIVAELLIMSVAMCVYFLRWTTPLVTVKDKLFWRYAPAIVIALCCVAAFYGLLWPSSLLGGKSSNEVGLRGKLAIRTADPGKK